MLTNLFSGSWTSHQTKWHQKKDNILQLWRLVGELLPDSRCLGCRMMLFHHSYQAVLHHHHQSQEHDQVLYLLGYSILVLKKHWHSVAGDQIYRQQNKISSLSELQDKLHILDTKYWTVVKQYESTVICYLVESPHPNIKLSVINETSLIVHTYIFQGSCSKYHRK